MKICCSWCQIIYSPKDPNAVKDPLFGEMYCTKGCRDADNLFKQIVERDYHQIQRQRKLRLSQRPH